MKTPLVLTLVFALTFGSLNAQDMDQEVSSVVNRKNSVSLAIDFFLTLSVNYERVIPLKENIAMTVKGGLGRDAGNLAYVITGETALLFGRQKKYFEPGIAFQYPFLFDVEAGDSPLLAIRAGYRYQTHGGFQFRIYPMLLIETNPPEDSWGYYPWLGLSLGYSF
ncbi:MAG: hypothetical protein ABFR62_09130 [Bacteroidota bacterium]